MGSKKVYMVCNRCGALIHVLRPKNGMRCPLTDRLGKHCTGRLHAATKEE